MADWIRIAPTLALLAFVVVAHFVPAESAKREVLRLARWLTHPRAHRTPAIARPPAQSRLGPLDASSQATGRQGQT
jgi:hypothetical protein